MDPVDSAQMLSRRPLNLVFDLDKDFEFQGSLGDFEMSEMFLTTTINVSRLPMIRIT